MIISVWWDCISFLILIFLKPPCIVTAFVLRQTIKTSYTEKELTLFWQMSLSGWPRLCFSCTTSSLHQLFCPLCSVLTFPLRVDKRWWMWVRCEWKPDGWRWKSCWKDWLKEGVIIDPSISSIFLECCNSSNLSVVIRQQRWWCQRGNAWNFGGIFDDAVHSE